MQLIKLTVDACKPPAYTRKAGTSRSANLIIFQTNQLLHWANKFTYIINFLTNQSNRCYIKDVILKIISINIKWCRRKGCIGCWRQTCNTAVRGLVNCQTHYQVTVYWSIQVAIVVQAVTFTINNGSVRQQTRKKYQSLITIDSRPANRQGSCHHNQLSNDIALKFRCDFYWQYRYQPKLSSRFQRAYLLVRPQKQQGAHTTSFYQNYTQSDCS